MKPLSTQPHICLITKGECDSSNFESEKTKILGTALAAASDGVNLIQIREKALPARLLFDLTRAVVEKLIETPTVVVVNDRPDVAIAAGADGVHLPENSFPPEVIRRTFPKLLIGVSTHAIEHAARAAGTGADYVFFGPVFETPGKGPASGVAELHDVCRELKSFPVIALGGIDEKNFEKVFASGAAGIAAIRSLNDRTRRQAIFEQLTRTSGKIIGKG